MNRSLSIFLFLLFSIAGLSAQESTQTEISSGKTGDVRGGLYQIAKPFEVSMTIYLWGEVPAQGAYIIPVATDLVQLISYASGPKLTADLNNVIVYRTVVSGKDIKSRQMKRVNVQDLLDGKAERMPLSPGDIIVIKKLPEVLTWQDIFAIVSTVSTVAVLGISIYNLTKGK